MATTTDDATVVARFLVDLDTPTEATVAEVVRRATA